MENENKNELRPETEINEEGNITVKRSKTADFIARIICLVLAFFVWYYAASTDKTLYEKKITDMPVTIENKTDFTIFTGDGTTVDVTFSGNRNSINKINSSAIKAKVIVTGITEAGQYSFDIRYEGLPSGVTVKSASAGWLQVYVGSKKDEDIPVTVELRNVPTNVDCEFSATSDVTSVRVSGPAVTVNAVKKAVLVLDLTEAPTDRSFDLEGKIVLLDESGDEINSSYLELSQNTAEARVTVTAERDVNISISFLNGFIKDGDCTVTPSVGSIKVRGEISAVNSAVIKCVIDEKALKNGVKTEYDLVIPSTLTASSTKVGVTVALNGMTEKTFTVTPVSSNGSVTFAPISVTVRGKNEDMAKLTADAIKAIVNTDNVMSGEKAIVEFSFEGEFVSSVYEIYQNGEPYTVFVNIAS